jgi:hypothetical protein
MKPPLPARSCPGNLLWQLGPVLKPPLILDRLLRPGGASWEDPMRNALEIGLDDLDVDPELDVDTDADDHVIIVDNISTDFPE